MVSSTQKNKLVRLQMGCPLFDCCPDNENPPVQWYWSSSGMPIYINDHGILSHADGATSKIHMFDVTFVCESDSKKCEGKADPGKVIQLIGHCCTHFANQKDGGASQEFYQELSANIMKKYIERQANGTL